MATNNAINGNFTVPITVSNGGTGQTTLTNHGVLVGAGTSGITQLAVGASNSVLAGTASSDPAFSTTAAIYANSISFDAGTTTLSNYAVGTWTPTLVGGSTAGSTTYAAQFGYYTRIGNLVTVICQVHITAATGTGDVLLGALPFTIKSQTNGNPMGNLDFNGTWTWPLSTTSLAIIGVNNTTTANIVCSGSAVGASNMQMSNVALTLNYSLTYQI